MTAHLYDLVRERAAIYPDAIALGGQQGLSWRTVTSRHLLELVDSLAEDLAARGVREGDRVVLWLPNHWRTPVYHFALWKLGAIVVPFDREMNPEAGARILCSVAPRLIITGYGERPAWTRKSELTEWWEPETDAATAQKETWVPPREELAMAVFTSGTTGAPKGCMITHANLCSQVDALDTAMPLDPSCRLASVLPLSHLFELTCGLLYPLARGAAVHFVPSRRGPDIVRVLQEQLITHMTVVPQLLSLMGQALQDQLRRTLPHPVLSTLAALASHLPLQARRLLYWPVHRRLGGHLRMMASGGAALAPETQVLWEQLGVRVVQGYGTSECSPVVACGTWDGNTPIGSVGRPIRGVEVRLASESELLVRGPNVMCGYWKDPEHTAEVLQDGWYATGDLARVDEDGNIWIMGRARDLIALPSGMNVWPQDVEDALRTHEAVKDAAVIPISTPNGGATLHAYLIGAQPGAPAAELSAVIASCNAHLAQHQRLATASWWPEADFPRTSTLKVRRALLPQPEVTATVVVDSVLADDDPVGQAIAGIAHVGSVSPYQTLAELGLDSLGLVELVVSLEEKTGKAVADGDLQLEMTVQQVRDMLTKAPDASSAEPHAVGAGSGATSCQPPMWPYTWGRIFRPLAAPIDLLYRYGVTETRVLGQEHLAGLPARAIFAGTHHGFVDMPLVRHALGHSSAGDLARRLVPATAASELAVGGVRIGGLGLGPWYAVLAFGLYPLRQDRGQDASLRQLVRVAEAGNSILIFPQGIHARPDQERTADPRARFRPGVAHLAAALAAPVVPFGLAGTECIVPPTPEGWTGATIARIPVSITPGPLAIAFGAPLTHSAGESPEAFTSRLQAACYGLTRLAENALPGCCGQLSHSRSFCEG